MQIAQQTMNLLESVSLKENEARERERERKSICITCPLFKRMTIVQYFIAALTLYELGKEKNVLFWCNQQVWTDNYEPFNNNVIKS